MAGERVAAGAFELERDHRAEHSFGKQSADRDSVRMLRIRRDKRRLFLHTVLLDRLRAVGEIDWSRAVVDSCSIRAVYGGDQTGPNPTDRAKRGSKRHLICDGRGVPLAVRLTGANRNDSQEALALVDAIPPLQGHCGRPRCRPGRATPALPTCR